MKNTKKKNLIFIGVAVAILALAIVFIVINSGNKNGIRGELSNRDFVETVDHLATGGHDHNGMIDATSLKAYKSILVADKMLGGTYTAGEIYNQLIEMGFENTELSKFHVEHVYGTQNFDNIDNDNVTFIEMVKYLCTIAETKEGKLFIGEENSKDLAGLSKYIVTALDVMDEKLRLSDEVTRDEFVTIITNLLNEEATKSLIGELSVPTALIGPYAKNMFNDYNDKYNNGKNVKVRVLDLIVYAVNEPNSFSNLISSFGDIDEIKAMVNTAAAFYDKAHKACPYTEFLPLMNELMEVVSSIAGVSKEFNYTDATVQQIYVMYFYDQGAFEDVKMNGKDFVVAANKYAAENESIGSVFTDGLKTKLAEVSKIDAFLSDANKYSYKDMTSNLNDLFAGANNLLKVQSVSDEWVGNIYTELSHGH